MEKKESLAQIRVVACLHQRDLQFNTTKERVAEVWVFLVAKVKQLSRSSSRALIFFCIGRFVLEERKLPYYEVPDLTGFKVSGLAVFFCF